MSIEEFKKEAKKRCLIAYQKPGRPYWFACDEDGIDLGKCKYDGYGYICDTFVEFAREPG